MAINKTTNYNLNKPDGDEFFNVSHQNDNMDLIDSALNTKLDKTTYTALDVLDKVKTVDGSGSGLDADKLDGLEATEFATAAQGTKADNALPASSYTASDVLTKIKTVDGAGSGLDADTVDGIQGADLVKKDGSVPMNNLTIGTRTGTVGTNSFAQGNNCEASGNYSHAEGYNTAASSSYSHAEGSGTTASGTYSHAEGNGTIASGSNSHAEGTNTTANGNTSHAEGRDTTASGNYSHAEGYYTTASGNYSHSQNAFTIAQGYAQTAIGRYNIAQGNPTSITATDDAFIIGNGTSSSARSNAFRVTFDGKAYGLSAYNSSGADYAEYFEWEDGNTENEDRVGYFVTLDGEKIRKANSTDDYILGVVSANATVIGDTASENWHKKYITDEFGRIQYEYVDVPAVLDDEGNEIEPARQDYVMKINPEWDSSQEYIPREERPEWSIVGMMGKLTVRDDGTCQVNGYCKSDNDGIATSSENGYRVMKRVSENIIQILVK